MDWKLIKPCDVTNNYFPRITMGKFINSLVAIFAKSKKTFGIEAMIFVVKKRLCLQSNPFLSFFPNCFLSFSSFPYVLGAMSAIWAHFKVKDGDQTKAICQLCQKELSRGENARTRGTSNLRRHIQSAHSDEWKKTEEADKKRKEANRELYYHRSS